MLLHITRKHL